MRLLLALISASALLASFSALRAEPVADRIVQVLNDACISPASPEGMIDAGNKFAATERWKLVDSGPAPLPMMHNDQGPKISFESRWEVGLPDRSPANLYISIVRPELPGVRHSICIIQPSADLSPGSLAQSLEKKFDSLLTKDKSGRYHDSETWFFSHERSRGNCGKQITLLHDEHPNPGNPRVLMYVDGVYPNDGNWIGPLGHTMCRS